MKFETNKEQESTIQPRTKKLFGHCFEITHIESGDLIPVGGNIFSNEATIKVFADFESFNQSLIETRERAIKYNVSKLREWLDSFGAEIEEKLFASLFAFTKLLDKLSPENEKRHETRKNLYKEKDGAIKLSDLFNTNSAECAEVAALAQWYLQKEGISSTYISGDVLSRKYHEFSSEHSFITIQHGDKTYIYDPANPQGSTSSTLGNLPALYTTELDFHKEISKDKKIFVPAKSIYRDSTVFYGVNDGTNVSEETDIA